MKRNLFLLFALLFFGCNDFMSTEGKAVSVIFVTDGNSYTHSDVLTITLKNETAFSVQYLLRCGEYLEIAYEIKGNGFWSEEKLFPYMFLRCPSEVDSLAGGEENHFLLDAEFFESIGEFRLVYKYFDAEKNLFKKIYSNTFVITHSGGDI